MGGEHDDQGFSLIELLLVMLVLAVLTTLVVLAVGGTRGDAQESACAGHRRSLTQAVEAYRVKSSSDTIAPTGADEPYEQTLVDGGFLTVTSIYYDLDEYGELVTLADSPCS